MFMHTYAPFRTPLLSLCLLAGLAGCATGKPPEAELARSSAAVNDALAAGANELAPLDLRQAQDKLEQARAAAAEEDFDKARRLAEAAEADARLAEVRSRNTRTQKAAAALQEDIRVLRHEMQRASGVGSANTATGSSGSASPGTTEGSGTGGQQQTSPATPESTGTTP